MLGIGRYYHGEKLLTYYNFAETERHVSAGDELGEYTNLLTGEAADKTDLTIAPGGFLWLGCDFDEKQEAEKQENKSL